MTTVLRLAHMLGAGVVSGGGGAAEQSSYGSPSDASEVMAAIMAARNMAVL